MKSNIEEMSKIYLFYENKILELQKEIPSRDSFFREKLEAFDNDIVGTFKEILEKRRALEIALEAEYREAIRPYSCKIKQQEDMRKFKLYNETLWKDVTNGREIFEFLWQTAKYLSTTNYKIEPNTPLDYYEILESFVLNIQRIYKGDRDSEG